jgi:hypothetical protein
MVVAVGEMAEAAVGALEWNHQRKVAKSVAKEWEWAEVEGELDLEKKENARLRATIAMYEQAFCQLHQQKLEDGNLSVERSMEVSQSFGYVHLVCLLGFRVLLCASVCFLGFCCVLLCVSVCFLGFCCVLFCTPVLFPRVFCFVMHTCFASQGFLFCYAHLFVTQGFIFVAILLESS